jgi:hypothetical protein
MCAIGRSYNNPLIQNLDGEIAAFSFWNRSLSTREMGMLAAHPPSNIIGELKFIGLPSNFPSTGGSITPVQISSTLTCAAGLTLTLSISPGGVMAPVLVSFAGLPQPPLTVSIDLNALPVGVDHWNLTWILSGPGAPLFVQPKMMRIWASNLAFVQASAVFTLNTGGPSQNADWMQVGNSGIVRFTAATHYLNLQRTSDVNYDAVMPSNWITSKGFTIATVRVPHTPAQTAS